VLTQTDECALPGMTREAGGPQGSSCLAGSILLSCVASPSLT
jgi:hypothetical protein